MPLTVCGFVGLNSGEELLRVTLNPSLSCTSLEGSSPKKTTTEPQEPGLFSVVEVVVVMVWFLLTVT